MINSADLTSGFTKKKVKYVSKLVVVVVLLRIIVPFELDESVLFGKSLYETVFFVAMVSVLVGRVEEKDDKAVEDQEDAKECGPSEYDTSLRRKNPEQQLLIGHLGKQRPSVGDLNIRSSRFMFRSRLIPRDAFLFEPINLPFNKQFLIKIYFYFFILFFDQKSIKLIDTLSRQEPVQLKSNFRATNLIENKIKLMLNYK
ncbi:hypothetical protein BpHYR1_013741 [Brachionus plicatilis]|uniref:Uncharacterized protein n=1 Tax=Brachionus plicatilis TaxID=10195 RepID=A0A3M7PAC6_BRAPC|nr:hypothetical protein BpHYR1_013741 [Brachionus plicatilis]